MRNDKLWEERYTSPNPQKQNNDKSVFSEKEIAKMPKKFRETFKKGKIIAHVRNNNGVYEVRCQVNKITIYGTSKDLATAKAKFIQKLNSIDFNSFIPKNVKFNVYFEKWLNTVKKPYIKENTFNTYLQTFNHDIKPYFINKDLASLKSLELQEYINKLSASGRNRVVKAVYQLIKAMFEFAVADEIIERSPFAKIKILPYEQEKATALTREEEKALIDNLTPDCTVSTQAFIFLLYTGMRRSELATVSLEDDFIKVCTSKTRVWQKNKFRLIPISPMLKRVLPYINIEKIKALAPDTLTTAFKKLCPNHHLHELRHTFITRCQECGIKREIVSLWAGHTADSSMTSKVYTHLENNKQIQIEEIEKFDYFLT